MKRKKTVFYSFCVGIVLMAVGGVYVFKNIPLRTAIFRTFVQGNWSIFSEKDTLYTLGYYGVKKYLSSDELVELVSNEELCENTFVGRLIARGGDIYDSCVYVSCRSYLPGSLELDDKDYINGILYVLNKNDLTVINRYQSDIKLVSAKVFKKKLIVSGLNGFDIYDLEYPNKPNRIFEYRHDSYTEFQDIACFETDSVSYVAFSRFKEGISIWDITIPEKTRHVKDLYLDELSLDINTAGLQCFSLISTPPLCYVTLAPTIDIFNSDNDNRGVLVLDFTNINDIKSHLSLIPRNEWYKRKIGDPPPSYIDVFEDKLYVNFGEKGIAVFSLEDPKMPHFLRIVDVSEGSYIQPIHINYRGLLYGGDYYWPDIYEIELDGNKSM